MGHADPLHRWHVAGLIAATVIVLTIPLYAVLEHRARRGRGNVETGEATFVGREKCRSCHQEAFERWQGSDHDHAMALASDGTVRGNFNDAVFEDRGTTSRFYRRQGKFFVETPGPDGKAAEFEISYTFGWKPLQQYLVAFPGGRLQALSIAWDVERGEWFHLYPDQDIPPDDWLHWTRAGQNWNGMCAECHSTNLRKGYDHRSRTFSTSWSEINVSCEACHGPGSRHVAWAEIEPMGRPVVENYALVMQTSGITSRQQVELCAPCHSRRTELGDYNHTSLDLLNYQVPAVLSEELYFADGQILEEVYVYGSFVQSKMFRNGIRCTDCHDAHSLKLVKDGNAVCTQCHRADAYDSAEHHFHKKIHQGRPSEGALCVKCHMPERPYMQIDYRSDHSIRVPRPDLSLQIGTPNACSQVGCHDDKPVTWSAEHHEKWYGRAKKPHYGTVLAAGRARLPEARPDLIRLAGDALYPAIVRATGLTLLGAYPSEETTAAFTRALGDDDPLVRYTAVMSVTPGDEQELAALVAPLLFDPLRAVRTAAATRLAGIPGRLLKPYQQEALRAALAEYERAMEYSLDFAFAGHNLGNLYARLREPTRAETYYRQAIEIDDLFYPAKVNLATLYNSLGRNQEAEALLRAVLGSHPELDEVAYSLALLLVEMGRPAEAVPYLERAAAGIPGRARVQYNLGLLYQQLGRTAAAEQALLKALALEQENVDYLYALAVHYAQRGDAQRALPLADRLIAAQPENPLGRRLKAQLEQALRTAPRE